MTLSSRPSSAQDILREDFHVSFSRGCLVIDIVSLDNYGLITADGRYFFRVMKGKQVNIRPSHIKTGESIEEIIYKERKHLLPLFRQSGTEFTFPEHEHVLHSEWGLSDFIQAHLPAIQVLKEVYANRIEKIVSSARDSVLKSSLFKRDTSKSGYPHACEYSDRRSELAHAI